MRFRQILIIIVAISSIFTSSLLFGSAGEGNTGTVYELSAQSDYQEGCVAPCTCPVKAARLSGTFRLVKSSTRRDIAEFNLNEISWSVTAYNGKVVHRITGAGIYRIAGKTHRLILDISIDEKKAHFDTGSVPDGSQFPAIKIIVDQGTKCLDTWINIDANPRK